MAHILIVEDEDNIAVALEFLLTRAGHSHRRLATGAGALDEMRLNRPDLVLLDIMLPDISGYQIITAMRADPALSGIRVLMMTARGSVVERKKGLELGADGFIAKPFELAELRAEMGRLLAVT
ncbi:DNA-binding response regulator [Paracoccus yeei]|jgi:DNA-binding response OmpR family regulator|uniref:DNA-binding response regulator n=1 Tax=Paracoccus yeei TaxID=147645 RepID=A0A1V0GWT9_9RHOB|nr:response regulator [Paracoccus yeei]ARC38354.1 DNA-binding response regulator [Paracoccus yeei]AYF01521.1 DNA-binding response regulator [Paracoccus yeei]MBY0135554.1 response regulator [Paracoccus yeei]OWJ95807.1 response regulator [Paracoccus yeei]QEU09417.1 response regulator transcription factor [Paracoccus yeei]